jgi:predicted HTH domain antitoxin
MAIVTMKIPDELVQSSPEQFAQELRLAAAIHWYTRKEISMGRAAQLAGMTLADFLDTLASKKIDVFQVDFDQLKEEVARGFSGG